MRIRQIPGWPGYSISDDGRVFSHKRRNGPPGTYEIDPSYRRELRPHIGSHGYPVVTLRNRDYANERAQCVHVLVAATFIGPRPQGHEVRHLDCDKTNCRVENLAYGTSSENKADSRALGRLRSGEGHAQSRLTGAQVAEIRTEYAKGEASQSELGARFGVARTTIAHIVNHRTWANAGPHKAEA